MHINIPIKVSQNINQVWAGFDQSLFKQLSPPFPPSKLLRFDGSLPNDEVHIELDFIFFKQLWISQITAHQASQQEIFFIDKGKKLPFFLQYWQHKHRLVAQADGGCLIIEEIEFKTFNRLTDLLFYPILYLQFWYRKPIYQRIFKH
jgi:ligand-binding SRPBCC domain-containing protein